MSRTIFRRLLPLVALIGALALIAGLASGSSGPANASKDRTTWRFETHGLQATLKQSDWPNPGATAIVTGTYHTQRTEVGSGVRTKVGGAWLKQATITGHPAPLTYTFKGTTRAYLNAGSHLSEFDGRFTIQPDRSIVLTANGHITSGAGIQKGAAGRFAMQGFAPSPTAPMQIQAKGWISY